MQIGKKEDNSIIGDETSKSQGQFTLMNRAAFYKWIMNSVFIRKNNRESVIAIDLIQNHHTWKPNYDNFYGDNHFKLLSGMKRSHLKRGFNDIAQNLTTFPDGTIAVCRPLNKIPAGIKGANSNGICIEHIGNFDMDGDEMTKKHKSTIEFVNAVLCLKFGLEVNDQTVVYHHWWTSKGKRTNGINSIKSCPGQNFYGGNKVEDAEVNFYPRIIKQLNALKTLS